MSNNRIDINNFHHIRGSESNNQFKTENLLEQELLDQMRIFYHLVKISKISVIEATQLLTDANFLIYNNTDNEEFNLNNKVLNISNGETSI